METPVLFEKFFRGQERSVKAKKNIAASFAFKGGSIIISFLLVPVTLNYLNPVRYGIWLTLSAIVSWLTFFDIGISNGLRNRFTEAKAKNNDDQVKTLVSTSYVLICLIILFLYSLFLIIHPFLNWIILLNAPLRMQTEISQLVFIVVTFFSIQFVFKLISTILMADQRPAFNDLFTFLTNLISLAIIYSLTRISQTGSLLNVGVALSASPVLVLLIANLLLFNTYYKRYTPKLKYVKMECVRDLISLGAKFFIIQISTVVLFTSSELMITQLFGPLQVTSFNISYRYFSIIIMLFTIVLTPMWTGFGDAYFRQDTMWIKNIMRKIIKMWVVLVFITITMIALSPIFFHYWIGDKIEVSIILCLLVGVFVLLNTGLMPFVYFMNGVGKISLQLYLSIFAILFNIPCSLFLVKNIGMKLEGIVLGSILSLVPFAVLLPIQYRKILQNSNTLAIWNK
ncbi:MAG: lipopolysaccharide biosynthesis protein [Methanococcaceae archaeon]